MEQYVEYNLDKHYDKVPLSKEEKQDLDELAHQTVKELHIEGFIESVAETLQKK